MSKLDDYQISLPLGARRVFSDAAISLALFLDANDDEDAEAYYYKRYKFNIDYAVDKFGVDIVFFDFYVRQYARELN